MKVLWVIPLCVFTAASFAQPDMNETMGRIHSLTKESKYEEALEIVEQALNEREDALLLQVKFTLLVSSGRHKEALEAALADWLEEAVNRGFTKYKTLAHSSFDVIRDTERFQILERCVKGVHGIGKPAKDFTVKMLSGDSFTLSSQKGRVVLIDFWATWCTPCLKEIPRMKRMYASYRDKGFEIISVSLDRRKGDVVKYVQEKELGWKVSYSGALWSDPTARLYGVNKIPSTWLVNKEGILREIGLSGAALEKAIIDLI